MGDPPREEDEDELDGCAEQPLIAPAAEALTKDLLKNRKARPAEFFEIQQIFLRGRRL